MVSVLMSQQASRHPDALTRTPYSLSDALSSKPIASVTSLLECARRADGAAVILVASDEFIAKHSSLFSNKKPFPAVIGGGETSSALLPPNDMTDGSFTCSAAADSAYKEAGLNVEDIDVFCLYDCFPICFIKALEAVRLASLHQGGAYVEGKYQQSLRSEGGVLSPKEFPINTHGGLLSFGKKTFVY